jgi:hypothetical protein
MPVTAETFRRVALVEPEGQPRRTPAMSLDHVHAMVEIGIRLRSQLDPRRYRVRIDDGLARRLDHTRSILDVSVVPGDPSGWGSDLDALCA